MTAVAIDPVTLEVIRNALASVADEMALVVMRSAYSPVVRDTMDYSTALCDRDGETRQAYFGPGAGLVDTPVTTREALRGRVVEGPLFVDEYDSTTVVPPGCRATLDGFGCIEIHVD